MFHVVPKDYMNCQNLAWLVTLCFVKISNIKLRNHIQIDTKLGKLILSLNVNGPYLYCNGQKMPCEQWNMLTLIK